MGSLVCVHAFDIPGDVLKFYSQNISHMVLSNTSILLYNSDQTQIYYMYYNGLNETLNMTISVRCVGANCPPQRTTIIDYLQNDTTLPYVKKAAGIYFMTNQTPLGVYEYNISIADASLHHVESEEFSVHIISQSFWQQFFYNLAHLFVFWQ